MLEKEKENQGKGVTDSVYNLNQISGNSSNAERTELSSEMLTIAGRQLCTWSSTKLFTKQTKQPLQLFSH